MDRPYTGAGPSILWLVVTGAGWPQCGCLGEIPRNTVPGLSKNLIPINKNESIPEIFSINKNELLVLENIS